jgi:hypothetical protein
MKLTKTMFTILLSAIVAKSDIITMQWRPSLQIRYAIIPAGKVCKIITMTENVDFGFIDGDWDKNWETLVHNSGKGYIVTSQNIITVAGPVKLFFRKKSFDNGALVTLDVVDQITPKSGVTFTYE